jgi:hypothetical protein
MREPRAPAGHVERLPGSPLLKSKLNRSRRHLLRIPRHNLALEQTLVRQQRRGRCAKSKRRILNQRLAFANGAIEILVML